MKVLSVKDLVKRYERFELHNVGLDVEKGEIVGFIGRNGAGKTTTLKCLLNRAHPESGDVRFFGLSFADNEAEIKRRVAFVTGGVDFYIHKRLAVITDVTRRFYPDWDDAAYRRYIQMFSLDERKTPDQLSAGMRVKYCLALALSRRAELLILDEPTSGLDPVSRDDLLDVFLELARQGVSILFSTHVTSDLDKCADRVAYIHDGRVLAFEKLEDFTGRYGALALADEQLTDAVRSKLVGLKPAKRGWTAIILRADAEALGLTVEPADLDTVMIHMEKEINA